eukprot:105834_1
MASVIQNVVCARCKKSNPAYHCSSCKITKYCTPECQLKHWKSHHKRDPKCKKFRKQRKKQNAVQKDSLEKQVSGFKSNSPKRIDNIKNVHLISSSNIGLKSGCKLSTCGSFKRVTEALRQYTLYLMSEEPLPYDANIHDDFFVGLLDYSNHLMSHHSNEFEDIYNTLNKTIYNNKPCTLSHCLMMRRNQRNRRRIT